MTHSLDNFAEIKFGIKTGANDFFYMKDVSSLYEADYLTNPEKFEKWGVKDRNAKELKEQGLIYIENEGKERFVINQSDTRSLIRTTRDLYSYKIESSDRLCLYTKTPGEFTKKYIEWGENKITTIRGKTEKIVGYNNVPSVSGRKKWYSLNELTPSEIILPMYIMDRFFIPYSDNPVICDNTFYTLHSDIMGLVKYLNSTIFYITVELYLRRLGGGVGEIKVDDYNKIPVPDLRKLDLTSINIELERKVMTYFDEIGLDDRKALDQEIINRIGIKKIQLDEFYNEFKELVDDRLIKADRPLKREGT